jgi:hypothetical protein
MESLSCMGTCVDGGRGGVLYADWWALYSLALFYFEAPGWGMYMQAARLVHWAGHPTP